MNMLYRTLATVALTALAATQAAAITYTGTRTVGTGSATLSITTDDTIGALATANVTAWTIALTQGSDQFTLTQDNSQLLIIGSALTATATELSFDFDASSTALALFQAPDIGSGQTYYCVESQGCSGNGRGETVLATTNFDADSFAARTGVEVLATATAAAVPEPATWGLMLVGFGLTGMGLRRRTGAALTA